jgi:hypothetical protein
MTAGIFDEGTKTVQPYGSWILRLSLHGAMSGPTMLLTYTRRRSGRTYTTPVNYVRDGDAPPLPLAAPTVEVLEDTTSGGARTLRLRVSSQRRAENLSLWLESDDPKNPDSPVLSAAVDGEPVEEPENPG